MSLRQFRSGVAIAIPGPASTTSNAFRIPPPEQAVRILLAAGLLTAPGFAASAAPQSPSIRTAAQEQPAVEEELEEVVVEGRRALRKPQAILDWMARLVGQFTVAGTVDLHGRSGSDLLSVNGSTTCVGLGPGPAVQCELHIRWPEAQEAGGEQIISGISNLDPAVMMFGFEPNRIGIRHMLVGNDGIADGALGYLLSGDTLVTRARCGGTPGTCERTFHVTAEPDAKTVRMEIEIRVDYRSAATIAFVMERVPGSSSRVYPGLR